MLTTDRQLVRRPAQKLQQYYFSFGFTCLFSSLHVLFVSIGTNFCSFHEQTLMEPKLDREYARGHSECVAPSARLVISFDDDPDLEYMPPVTPLLHGMHVPPETPLRRWSPA